MGCPELQLGELVGLAANRRMSSVFGVARHQPIIVVHLNDEMDAVPELQHGALHELATLPAVIVGMGRSDHPGTHVVDVIVDPQIPGADLVSITDAISRRPLASVALCLLLRHGDGRTIAAGLVAELTTYSMLQAGPEFASWIEERQPVSPVANDEPPVIVVDDDDTITILLNRPRRHNAVDVELSEALVDALTDALVQPARRVVLRGNGPSFSSGGDLAEFGGFADPVSAHAIRLSRSAGQLIAMMSDDAAPCGSNGGLASPFFPDTQVAVGLGLVGATIRDFAHHATPKPIK